MKIFDDRINIVEGIVAFLVLMGADEKILDLAPGYILEKYQAVLLSQCPELLLIDDAKRDLLRRYVKKWAN